jgi:hypothetical protein
VVIMIVAAVITAGAALGAIGAIGTSVGGLLGFGAGLAGAGVAAAATVSVTVGAVLTAAAVGAGVYAAASVLTQGLAVAAGLQDSFSWKAVGKAAIQGAVSGAAGAITGGIAKGMGFAQGSWQNVAVRVSVEAGKQVATDGKITSVAGLVGAAAAGGAFNGWGQAGTLIGEHSRAFGAGLGILESKAHGRGDNAMSWVGLATAAVLDSGSVSPGITTDDGKINWSYVALQAVGAAIVGQHRGEDAGLSYFGNAIGSGIAEDEYRNLAQYQQKQAQEQAAHEAELERKREMNRFAAAGASSANAATAGQDAALGNASGSSIADAMSSPSATDNRTALSMANVKADADYYGSGTASTGGASGDWVSEGAAGSGLRFTGDAVASWSRQVNSGIRAAALADASQGGGLTPGSSTDSFFPQPQVAASGVDEKGLAWYRWDDDVTSRAIANPVIETHELPPAVQGPGLLASGRSSMNAYWSQVADEGVSEGSFLKYLAGRTMQFAGNVGYSLADMGVAVYENPEQGLAGGVKSIANFGPEAFNGAVNLVKTSLNGYSLLAENLGAGEGTFSWFRESDPYNITPLLSYDNEAQAGGALFTQVALGAGLAKYGNYRVELNLGEPGVVYSNPMPLRLVAPEAAEGGAGIRVEVRNGYAYTLDDTGRAVRIQGELTSNPAQVRNIQAQLEAGGSYRLSTDEGGHFIGRRFNGPLDDFNHFAQNVNFNRGAYKSLENTWQRALDLGQPVYVDIKPSYAGPSLRPEGLRINYSIDGQPSRVSFKNKPGG